MSSTTATSVICSRPVIKSYFQTTKKANIGHMQHLKLSYRLFSSTAANWSKIGRLPLTIPPGVTVELLRRKENKRRATSTTPEVVSRVIEVKGPLGKTQLSIPPYVSLTLGNNGYGPPVVGVDDPSQTKQRQMWGTVRAYLKNDILGVSEGHSTILRLVGVGYRASIEDKAETKEQEYPDQQFVSLKVGYSHPIELGVPYGIKASTPQPTRILLEGLEKQSLNQFAAQIREWRKPEPYKGKGIFVNNETIRIKSKKIK